MIPDLLKQVHRVAHAGFWQVIRVSPIVPPEEFLKRILSDSTKIRAHRLSQANYRDFKVSVVFGENWRPLLWTMATFRFAPAGTTELNFNGWPMYFDPALPVGADGGQILFSYKGPEGYVLTDAISLVLTEAAYV